MASRKILLRVASGLSFFTAAGHTFGMLMPIPAELTELTALYAQMKATLSPMPIGGPKDMLTIFNGNNAGFTLLLSLCGAVLWRLARAEPLDKFSLVAHSLTLLGVSIISALCFFPAPAVCTALAAVLGLWVAFSSGGNPSSKTPA